MPTAASAQASKSPARKKNRELSVQLWEQPYLIVVNSPPVTTHYRIAWTADRSQWILDEMTCSLHTFMKRGWRALDRFRDREKEREREERREGKEPLRRSNAMLSLYLSLFLSKEKNRLGRGVSFHRNEEYWKILFVMYNYRRVRNHLEITGWSLGFSFFVSPCFRDTKCTGFLVLG